MDRAKPRYLICDKGKQFWCEGFKGWCDRKGIRPRFGAVGKKGSIAVIERFNGSLKNECMDVILVPIRKGEFRRELALFSTWYNQHRPHSALRGQTPDEAYNGMKPANHNSRLEPRAGWPVGAVCASSQAPVAGERGAIVRLEVSYYSGRKHLLIVTLKRAGVVNGLGAAAKRSPWVSVPGGGCFFPGKIQVYWSSFPNLPKRERVSIL